MKVKHVIQIDLEADANDTYMITYDGKPHRVREIHHHLGEDNAWLFASKVYSNGRETSSATPLLRPLSEIPEKIRAVLVVENL